MKIGHMSATFNSDTSLGTALLNLFESTREIGLEYFNSYLK